MTDDRKLLTEFEPGRGYTQEDWDEVSDNPEFTEADMTAAKPFAEAFPAMAEGLRRSRGRPKAAVTKEHINIRLSPQVVEHFKAAGPGWQSRIDAALVQWIEEHGRG